MSSMSETQSGRNKGRRREKRRRRDSSKETKDQISPCGMREGSWSLWDAVAQQRKTGEMRMAVVSPPPLAQRSQRAWNVPSRLPCRPGEVRLVPTQGGSGVPRGPKKNRVNKKNSQTKRKKIIFFPAFGRTQKAPLRGGRGSGLKKKPA